MAQAKRSGRSKAGTMRDELKKGALIAIGVLVAGFLIAVLIVSDADGGGITVPPPTPTERADTVTLLGAAAQAHDICYGWRLQGGTDPRVSIGSNLGDGVPVNSDPLRCPRWVEVSADVTYTGESSEQEDSASYWVNTSGNVAWPDFDEGLTRLGLSTGVFLDDPGWAVCRAAVFLPLLMVETGTVPAVVPAGAPATAPPPLPDPSSDMWRDRWAGFSAAGAFLLGTVLFVGIGLLHRRRLRLAAKPGGNGRQGGDAGRQGDSAQGGGGDGGGR